VQTAPEQAQPPATGRSGKPVLAVLPLNNMSGDAAQDGFADGLTEDLITALSQSGNFDVTARNSTFAYKGQSPDIREVARALGANYVLEGSIRQGRGRARITVQLIDAATGNHVWAERFDRSLDDEFAVQDEMTQRIYAILTERIWQDAARNIGKKQLQDYTAHDYASRAMELLHRFDPHSMSQAQDFLQAGLTLDPDDRFCHLILGYCCNISATFWDNQGGTVTAQAHDHALRADEIASDAQTYRLLSRTHNAHQRWEEAWDCIQRSLRMDPNDGDIIGTRGIYHLFHGEFGEAIEWLDKVLEMHTDTPHTVDIMRYWKALALFATTEYAAATALLRSISGLDFLKAELLAACYARLGETDKAQDQAAEVLKIYPTFHLQNINLWQNFRDKSDSQNLLHALREAGLPD
jgi:adenylate cyclase